MHFFFGLAGTCPAKFRHWQTWPEDTILNDKQCFAVTPDLYPGDPNGNGNNMLPMGRTRGRAACKRYDANSEFMEEHGQAWCDQSFRNHIKVYIYNTIKL